LGLAIVEQGEIIFAQVAERAPFGVAHHDAHDYHIALHAQLERWFGFVAGDFGPIGPLPGVGKKAANQKQGCKCPHARRQAAKMPRNAPFGSHRH